MVLYRLALACTVLALGGCGIPTPPPFYQAAATAAPPGTVISAEPFSPGVKDAAAYRVLYDSTDINGRNIPVSGVVYIPLAPPPPGGRNIVAWAHPTTGIAAGCAPSLFDNRIGGISFATSIPGLDAFISAGDIVAATDYPGLGAPGLHPYLIGAGEGRAIIDSVRAARSLPGASASSNYVVWGHSQGGQAALFAGQISATYAPELHLAGVAAAAPPTDMTHELTAPFKSESGRLLAAYVYYSWAAIYHVPITTIVAPQAVPAVNIAVTKCIGALGQGIDAIRAAAALNPVFRDHDPKITPPWPGLLAENSPGNAPPGAPLLIVQGTADTTVEPRYAESFTARVCAKHETIEYQELPGVSHLMIAYKSLPVVTSWLQDRFSGVKPPDNCGM
jgi:alpha-beta hydrolase superfamily lysophospholipase